MRYPALSEQSYRLGYSFSAAVGHVIARQANHSDSCSRYRSYVFRRGCRSRHVSGSLKRHACMWNFKVANGEVTTPQRGRDAR